MISILLNQNDALAESVKMFTPWGLPDEVMPIAQGIVRVETPSHGGYKLSEARNAEVPDYMRNPADSFGINRSNGWYEEDCDWSILALVFPQFFPAEAQDDARRCMSYFRQGMLTRWDAEKGQVAA